MPNCFNPLNCFTGLIRRVRNPGDEICTKRGRPVLVCVRLPDLLEYRHHIGMDVRKWLEGGLRDLMPISSCYFHLNDWALSAELGNPAKLAGLAMDYFASVRGIVKSNGGNLRFEPYWKIGMINPSNPRPVAHDAFAFWK